MTAPLNTAKLGLLTPALVNPATAAAVGIGLIAVGLLRLLSDDEEETTVDSLPMTSPEPAVGTVEEPLPAIKIQTDETATETSQTSSTMISEVDQKEMIRNAMSELGKRSAAARAKKKAERQEQG